MESFHFQSPTNMVLGEEAELEAGPLIKTYANGVLVVPGGEGIRKAAWYKELLGSLTDHGILYDELVGVEPNPKVALVRAGIDRARARSLGFVLSVGGGSAVDTAKAVALGVAHDSDVLDFFTGAASPTAALPVGCVMTIPSSGSEASNISVLTHEQTQAKLNVTNDLIRPVFALMNAELTYSVPWRHIFAGISDTFSHVVERYCSTSINVEVTDRLCEGLMKAIVVEADRLRRDFLSYEARSNLMLASLLAHNGLLGVGRQEDWATHAMASAIGGRFGCIHGEVIAVLWPHWADHVSASAPKRFADIGTRVFGLGTEGDVASRAAAGIAAMRDFWIRIGLPTTLAQLGVNDHAGVAALAAKVTHDGPVGNLKSLDQAAVQAIYHAAR
jgi:alcohol dehydrogenase YqhD (iron-dependent ADH family)